MNRCQAGRVTGKGEEDLNGQRELRRAHRIAVMQSAIDMPMSDAQIASVSSTNRFTYDRGSVKPFTATGANSDPGAIPLANGESQQKLRASHPLQFATREPFPIRGPKFPVMAVSNFCR